jgi:hypothetical protein
VWRHNQLCIFPSLSQQEVSTALIMTHFVSEWLFEYLSTSILYVKSVITTKVVQRNKNRKSDSKQKEGVIVNKTGWICCK